MMDEHDRSTEAFEAPDALPALSALPVRLFEVFFSPGRLMESLAARPVWLGAILMGGVLTALSIFLIPQELSVQVAREAILEQGGEVPPGFEDGAGMFRYVGMVFGPLFLMIFTALTSGVVFVVFNFVVGQDGTYRQYLSVVAHGFLIPAVGGLLITPLRIAAEDPQLLLSVGTFFPFLGDGYFGRLLDMLDLFGLWGWAVIALGVTRFTRMTWKGAAFAILPIPIGLAAIFAIFA